MHLGSALRSGAFRFAIMLAAVFAVGSIALLLLVEHSVGGYAAEVARDSVRTEALVLRDEQQADGLPGLIRSIKRRQGASSERQLRYLLIDPSHLRIAGTLPAGSARLGWFQLTTPNSDQAEEGGPAITSLTALGIRLPGSMILVVASDNTDRDTLRVNLWKATIVFGAAISCFVLIGGFIVGSLFVRRLGKVNEAVEQIIEGRFAERLPSIGMSPGIRSTLDPPQPNAR